MKLVGVYVGIVLAGLSHAALDTVNPTGQCTSNHAIGKGWSCFSTILGCQYDGQPSSCQFPKVDKDIGHQICDVSKGETIILPQDGGSQATTNGKKCQGSSYEWVMAEYNWQCCVCPSGYRPAGSYTTSIDGHGSYTYDRTLVGGSVEKTCMKCTDPSEVLTYDYSRYEWSCKRSSSSMTTASGTTFTTLTTIKINNGTTTTTSTMTRVNPPFTTITTTSTTTTTTTTKSLTSPTTTKTSTTTKTITKATTKATTSTRLTRSITRASPATPTSTLSPSLTASIKATNTTTTTRTRVSMTPMATSTRKLWSEHSALNPSVRQRQFNFNMLLLWWNVDRHGQIGWA